MSQERFENLCAVLVVIGLPVIAIARGIYALA